jgi:hypothetical protein
MLRAGSLLVSKRQILWLMKVPRLLARRELPRPGAVGESKRHKKIHAIALTMRQRRIIWQMKESDRQGLCDGHNYHMFPNGDVFFLICRGRRNLVW